VVRDAGHSPSSNLATKEILLEAEGLTVGYGPVAVVHDLNLRVDAGQVVTLLGPNGAGKTTTLLALGGVLPAQAGEVRLHGLPAPVNLYKRVRNGMGLIFEERGVFRQLSLKDNLRVAGVDADRVLELFPELKTRLKVKAGLLSGGEQQMLAVGRALSRDADVLLIDELSMGLAPLIVDRLLKVLREAADSGKGVLLVEQHVRKVLEVADYGYVLHRGTIGASGTAEELRNSIDDIEAMYFAKDLDHEA
jgi:branched-chain amino acid transport system ATP-binding protein